MSMLERLLRPKSIALIGGIWARNVYDQLIKSKYRGDIWPVHPKEKILGTHQCFRNIKSLPASPDASFVAVNRFETTRIIRELSKIDSGGAICFASGYSESAGEETDAKSILLESELLKASGNMPILGPNCYGLLNYLDNVTLWPDQHGGLQQESGVAIIAQSSNIAINITMQRRSLPVAYMITVGNQIKSGVSDIIDFILDDPRITAIGLYLEGFDDISYFQSVALKAVIAQKPIVAIKIGKTLKSIASTFSHTASITGNSAASSALFRRAGILEVSNLSEFLETLKFFHFAGCLNSPDIASVSCSGGEAGLMADLADGSEINFRTFGKKAETQLLKILGPIVTVANPFDYHTFIWGDTTRMTATFSTVLKDGFALVAFLLDVPRNDLCNDESFQCAINAIIESVKANGCKAAVIASIPESMPEELAAKFISAGIVPLCGMEHAIVAIGNAISLGNYYLNYVKPSQLLITKTSDKKHKQAKLVDEALGKTLLKKQGVKVPNFVTIDPRSNVTDIIKSKNLKFPMVIKSLGLAHKTEYGSVQINIKTLEELKQLIKKFFTFSEKILIEEMITDSLFELSIGIIRDKTGLFLMKIGSGGIWSELFSDQQYLLLPVQNKDIRKALEQLSFSKILKGYRGGTKVNKLKLIQTIKTISTFAKNNSSVLMELEVNPLIVGKENSVAADVLIINVQ